MQEILSKLTIKQKILIGIITLVLITIGFALLYRYFYSDSDEVIISGETNEIVEENIVTITEETNSKIGLLSSNKKVVVHVIGEIKNPGVVTLDDGARIIDAINAAGGKTEDADLSRINLAYILEDGVQIYIPRFDEKNKNTTLISSEAGDGVITENSNQEEDSNKTIKVNINTANLDKLKSLPGVGEATAKKIIEYREKNGGKFKSVDELKKVEGIGDSKFNNLKEYVTIK